MAIDIERCHCEQDHRGYYLTRWQGEITGQEFHEFIEEIGKQWRSNHHAKKTKMNVVIVDTSDMRKLFLDFKIFRSLVSGSHVRTDLVYVNAPGSWRVLGSIAKSVLKTNMYFCNTIEEAINKAEQLAKAGHTPTHYNN